MKKLLRLSVNFLPMRLRLVVKNLPRIAAFQRWLIRSVLSDEPFLHTINAGPAKGLRFEVLLPHDKGIWLGTFESDFAGVIARAVKPGQVCYDIGGYRGYLSGVMALQQRVAKVVVFEPLPANQEALRRLRELNPQLPIELQAVAVGNVDGVMKLKVMPEASMGKLASSSFQPDAVPQDEISVQVRRLDSLVASGQIPPPHLMKIDVERAELEVLLGAAQILSSAHPIIFLEAHSAALEDACMKELLMRNYRIQRLEAVEPLAEETRHLIATPA